MADVNNILKNVNVFVDGRGYAGKATQVTLPEVSIQTEEVRPGGQDGPVEVDMGTEAMEASLQFASVEKELLGSAGTELSVTVRGATRDQDATVHPVRAELTGRVKNQGTGDWTPGERSTTTLTLAVDYYRLEIDGESVLEIDVPNMIRKVNGEDQLAGMREALGL